MYMQNFGKNFFSQNSIYTLQKIGKQLVIDFTTKERERLRNCQWLKVGLGAAK